ncbi:hypothetical protein BXZ70DRAFT_1008577 [Cristinia sonorae]|uniref:Uncharacterized protein n=1 Tax=Cristinia sonorae TaxID=1940300 RepID=A0A8K0XPF9_9AGAR|nr:hypothetical protein BXZ70DRAFT_1008577 [Cristinia sonorae]
MPEMMHFSPLHCRPPTSSITSWSELSSALHPSHHQSRVSSSRVSHPSTSSTRPRQHSLPSHSHVSISRYAPYTAKEPAVVVKTEKPVSPVKGSSRRKPSSDRTVPAVLPPPTYSTTQSKSIILEQELLRQGETERYSAPRGLRSVQGLDPMPFMHLSVPERRPPPSFPHTIHFEQRPRYSDEEPTLGIPILDVKQGRMRLVGETDRPLKLWPHEILILKVPGVKGDRTGWEIEVNTFDGKTTRLNLLKAAARAVESCCVPNQMKNETTTRELWYDLRIKSMNYHPSQGIWMLDFGY